MKNDSWRLEDIVKLGDEARDAGTDSLTKALYNYNMCLKNNIPIHAKGMIHQRLWQVEKKFGRHGLYFSQAGQDRFINETLFNHKKDGTFIEIGAYNGWYGSNCLFFEKFRNWTGLIVEASPSLVRLIPETRSGEVVHAAISDKDGTAEFIEVTSGKTQMGGLVDHYTAERMSVVRKDTRHAGNVVKVPSMRLATLLHKYNLNKIDYCSIDVEGAERAILSSFDFNQFDISVFSIENSSKSKEGYFDDIMKPAGYKILAVIGADEVWTKIGSDEIQS